MKRFMLAMVMLALVAALPNLGLAGYGHENKSGATANAGFEKLKSLAGTWDTTAPEGGPATVTYQVVSNGTAVMETISHSDEPQMITMYTVDGDHLMMTHYCGIGNQPRMRASVPSGDVKELKFNFVDGANMKKTDMHMHALDMKFIDATHVDAVWSLWDKGKLQNDHTFNLTKKS
jgi:hypothetical protein